MIEKWNIKVKPNMMRLHGRWFTGKRHKYTFRNLCIEDNEVFIEWWYNKAILRTKGDADDVSMPLKIFLDYVDGKKSEDALMQEINT